MPGGSQRAGIGLALSVPASGARPAAKSTASSSRSGEPAALELPNLMAKNLKRQPITKAPRKTRVNGHGLAHDDGFAASDDDAAAPAARDEEESGWTDEEKEQNPHGD